MILTSADAEASTVSGDNYAWYVMDGKLSRSGYGVFSTEKQWNPYLMLELSSLTNIIGVTITSRDEENNDGVQSINGVEVRAGTVKMLEMCKQLTVDAENGLSCELWKDNEFCGSLNINGDVLPLREYTIMCHKGLLARIVTVQLVKPDQDSLTFEEITLIRGSFLDRPNHSNVAIYLHGSAGKKSYLK